MRFHTNRLMGGDMKADECWSAVIVTVCCAVCLILVPNTSTDIIWKLKLGMSASELLA